MSTTKHVFRSKFARRVPDPNFHKNHGTERHYLTVSVKDMPRNISLDPNARRPNTNRRVYRDVQESLLDNGCEPGTFHLKNKGITIIADSIEKVDESNYAVELGEGHGIVDGGHTYEIIQSNLENEELPDRQYVEVEVLTNVPQEWIPDIAGGLNTTVQVQEQSLQDLKGAFDWIKEELKGEPYYSKIAWSENDPGEFDARDIVSMMTCFNIDLFPNDDISSQPTNAYTSKAETLKMFKNDSDNHAGEKYKKLKPILKDILQLYDMIRLEFREAYNQGSGRAASLKITDKRQRGNFEFPFISKASDVRLTKGATYPIFASFRWMVIEDPATGEYRWKSGKFSDVKKIWKKLSPHLCSFTVEKAREVGNKPDAIGKSRAHWSNLHRAVAVEDLTSNQ